ncbi:MAG: N-acetyl-gamma-glutamyl-phosphate reductase [Candidatus Pelagibacter sp.]
MSKINVLIYGSTGYIGIQLTKILANHKKVNIKYLCGRSSIGKSISLYDTSLGKHKLPKIVKFNKKFLSHVDVIFTALPNGESQRISKLLLKKNILIDLSADFRLRKSSDFFKWYKIKHKAKNMLKHSTYGLSEIKRNKIKNSKIISCPGCYPTSILLPLIPILNKNLIFNNNIIIDSKSGYSGAGRGVHKKFKNQNLYESLSTYGLPQHRHNSEIQQELDSNTGKINSFQFTPHLTPMFRGILSTIYIDLKKGVTIKNINTALKKYYKNEQFVKIDTPNTLLSTNDVINTNNCIISVCNTKYKNKLIILSVIDNLIKGGSGQAVQNMNIYYNFKENEGLNEKN